MEDNLDGRMHALNGFAMLRRKGCAEHRMALSQPSKGASQSLQLGVPRNGNRASKVIGRSLRRYFVVKPQSRLSSGERVLVKRDGSVRFLSASDIHV